MNPVEIEILMNDRLTPGVEKGVRAMDELVASSRRLQEAARLGGDAGSRSSDQYAAKLQGLRPHVEKMSASLREMGVSASSSAGALQQGLEGNVKFIESHSARLQRMESDFRSALEQGQSALTGSLAREMEAERGMLDETFAYMEKYSVLVADLAVKQSGPVSGEEMESLRQQLRGLTNDLAQVTLSYRRMSDAEKDSAAGRELRRKMEELVRKAGEVRDVMDDVNREIRGEASDTRHFDALAGGLNVLASTAGAATSVFEMFGASQEDLVNIQTKLQATLAISNALSVVQNQLQKEGALMLGIHKVQAAADTAAIAIRTAAEGKGVIVTKLATVAQAAFNVVAKANPYVLLAMAVLSVVGAMVAFTKGTQEATEAEKDMQRESDRLKAIHQEMATAIGNAVGGAVGKYKALQAQWNALRTDMERSQFVRDHAQDFKSLSLAVKDVTDAQAVLVEMAPAVINALTLVAEATAYQELYVESIRRKETEWVRRQKSKATGDYYTKATAGNITEEEHIPAGLREGQDFYRDRMGNAYYSDSGVAKVDALRAREAQNLRRRNERLYDEDSEHYKQKMIEKLQAAETAKAGLGRYHIPESRGGSATSTGRGGHPGKGGDTSGDELRAEQERAAELAELRQKNQQAEIDQMAEGAAKRRRQVIQNYEEEMAAIAEQEERWKKAQSGRLTGEQEKEITTARTLAEKKKTAELAAIDKEEAAAERARLRADAQAKLEYLKEYGSFQQQKLAIAQEYADKIAEVDASGLSEEAKRWQRMKLEKERDGRLSKLSFEQVSGGIDWHALLSGVNQLTTETMTAMMTQLRAFTQTDEYRQSDGETKQMVAQLISEMRKYLGTDQSVSWEGLEEALTRFTGALRQYELAKAAEGDALKRLEEGRGKYARGEITADHLALLERRYDAQAEATAKAAEEARTLGQALNNASEEVANYTSGLTVALENVRGWKGVKGFNDVENSSERMDQLKGTLDTLLPTLAEGTAKELGAGLSHILGSIQDGIGQAIGDMLSSGIGALVGVIAQLPKLIMDFAGSIKNMVTGILDSFTEFLELRWIEDMVVSILDSVGRLVEAIFDLPESLYKVLESLLVNGVGGLVNTVLGRLGNVLTLGLLSSKGPAEWFTNSNAKEVAATIERLTKRNELLEQAIEDLTDEMKTARGASAIDASKRARELQEATIANYKAIARAQAGYHGSHHSFNAYWGGYSQEQIERLSQQIGRQWNGDLWSLSPEEMKMLRSNVDMWEQIMNTGKGGYGSRVAEKLDDYIDQAGKLQEITDALYETLTTTTRDNVFDDFLNSLYGLADGSEDVMTDIAENWQQMVNRMAVNNLVGGKFQKLLSDWYEELAKLNESRTEGVITDAEYRQRLDALKRDYEGYVESAKQDLDMLRREGIVRDVADASGVTQSGKAGAFTTMSQDQAVKLEGLFVSGQMHWSSMDDKLTDVSIQIGDVGDTLKMIEEHTGSSASSLEEIKEDLKQMKRDGVRMR